LENICGAIKTSHMDESYTSDTKCNYWAWKADVVQRSLREWDYRTEERLNIFQVEYAEVVYDDVLRSCGLCSRDMRDLRDVYEENMVRIQNMSPFHP
jgi:hypothetical protein